MSIKCIKLNKDSYCKSFAILQELPSGWIEVSDENYPNSLGQRFDPRSNKWLDEFDEQLTSLNEKKMLSESEQMELDNYLNILYLTSMAYLGM